MTALADGCWPKAGVQVQSAADKAAVKMRRARLQGSLECYRNL
jgi:hypothetical protein